MTLGSCSSTSALVIAFCLPTLCLFASWYGRDHGKQTFRWMREDKERLKEVHAPVGRESLSLAGLEFFPVTQIAFSQ